MLKAGELLEKNKKGILSELVKEGSKITNKDIINAAAKGDVNCRQLLENRGKYLGKAIADIINLIDLQVVILVPNFSTLDSEYEYKILNTSYKENLDVNEHIPDPVPKIIISDLTKENISIGPAYLVIKQVFTPALNLRQDSNGKISVGLIQ